MKKFDISVLSVAPLRQGETMKQGIDSAVSLAKAVDNMGYKQFGLQSIIITTLMQVQQPYQLYNIY